MALLTYTFAVQHSLHIMLNLYAIADYPSPADFTADVPPHLVSKLIPQANVAYTQQPWGTILLQELVINGFTIGIYHFEILSYCQIRFGFSKPLVALQYALKGLLNPAETAGGYPFQHLRHGLFYLPTGHSISIHFEAGQYLFSQIHYPLSLVQKFTIAQPDFIQFQQPWQQINHFISASIPIDKHTNNIVHQIGQHVMERPLNAWYVNDRGMYLLMRFIREFNRFQYQQKIIISGKEQFINLEDLIHDHFSSRSPGIPSSKSLAKKLNLSVYQLNKLSQTIYNLSISSLITKTRMEIAISLLSQQTLTISEISYRVGYQSLSSFTRAFKKQYGFPPSRFSADDA